jgi:hypothetical protein
MMMIGSRRIRRVNDVARMEEIIHELKLWSVNVKGRDNFEDTGVDWRIMLKWILRETYEKMWTG